MSLPRQVLPGTTYLVTRRCAQREFLLRPSRAVNALFTYVLAVVAKRYGILVHAFCVLSNHVHLVLTDPNASLPDFERDLNSLVARALNVLLGRSESFWASASKYSAVTLLAADDVLDKAAYVLTNPVAAGLVPTAREWPGAWSDLEQLGEAPLTVHRPDFFFRKKGPMPETAELELAPPPGFETIAAFRKAVLGELAAREQLVARVMARAGRAFLGAARVLRQKPTARPVSEDRVGALNPRIAGRDKWKRIEALAGLVEFRRAYREAWTRLRAGARDVLFPAGTYWLRVAHGVRCAAAA
jgi:REP element-mobilizing transposase RayT